LHLSSGDWAIIIGYLVFALAVGLAYAKRAGRGLTDFFASGRALPWWIVGTSMVATTFSTDTPNLVTDLVRVKGGVSGNWLWWAFLLSGMMTVFFYARMWRRSEVLTDIEFYEVRYSGAPAAFVRGFRAIYLGVFFNVLVMASVTLAATKIAQILFGWKQWVIVVLCGSVAVTYSVLSGLWGVVITDLFQFAMAMVGAFTAAYYSVGHPAVGGLAGLVKQLPVEKLNFFPQMGNAELLVGVFVIPLIVSWWAMWYPGSEPGGGAYVAQRMFAAKNERHSMLSTLWFNVAHYALRPWPWILVALSSMVVFPHLSDIKEAFPNVQAHLIKDDIAYPAMLKFLPHGFLGLMTASLIAAYMSTIDTHLNWGASYVVNDFYKRFLRRSGSDEHYILISRLVTAGLMVLACGLSFFLISAARTFEIMLMVGAGTGLIYLLRWFWWRVNAWSEISAMIAAVCGSLLFALLDPSIASHWKLLGTVCITTSVWLTVTFLTRPTPRETLVKFYRLVRPAGPGWKSIASEAPEVKSPDNLTKSFAGWVVGSITVYSALFATGSLLYGRRTAGYILAGVFFISGTALLRIISRSPAEKEG
jgi:SSS family solute:Na+ symporter